ncbi:hypothetical protein [Streptomyces sp. NPDC002952]|uniref:hypothetical protein n=1 Tax=Streptomyces sp. NPDC002952 TaxID=3364673 RepID=UPI0036BB67B8
MVLLKWIAEVADEPLVLEPGDRRLEWETNTWSLTAHDEDRRSLSVGDVVAAFERTASVFRDRVHGLGFVGAATFYVWHDRQAGQLRCSTGSVPAHVLPFGTPFVPWDDLGRVVEGYLVDGAPGVIACSDLQDVHNDSGQNAPGTQSVPFNVWVSSVGTTAR